MGAEDHNFAIDVANGALAWWRDAGVDVVVDEAPHDWLSAAVASKSVAKSAEPAQTALPATLPDFAAWLKSADLPDAGPPARRIAPAGDPASDLMILTDFPEIADIDSGLMLSGALNDLFEKMLSSINRDRSSVYLATLCPGRPPTGALSADSLDELARIARHHIALVAPKQLWLMGSAASRAILGIQDAQAKGKLHDVNLDGLIVNAIATAHPRLFDGSKSRKLAAWDEMKRLIAKDHA